jgi:hypothetical protein
MAKAITIANNPEKETKEALNPYTEISETPKAMTAMQSSKRGSMGFENKIRAVMMTLNPVLIKIALTLRFLLPGISPGAFKKAPTTTGSAYSK